jgi:hypothetical protein
LTMHELNISHIVNYSHFSLANFFMVKKYFDNTFKPCHKSR